MSKIKDNLLVHLKKLNKQFLYSSENLIWFLLISFVVATAIGAVGQFSSWKFFDPRIFGTTGERLAGLGAAAAIWAIHIEHKKTEEFRRREKLDLEIKEIIKINPSGSRSDEHHLRKTAGENFKDLMLTVNTDSSLAFCAVDNWNLNTYQTHGFWFDSLNLFDIYSAVYKILRDNNRKGKLVSQFDFTPLTKEYRIAGKQSTLWLLIVKGGYTNLVKEKKHYFNSAELRDVERLIQTCEDIENNNLSNDEEMNLEIKSKTKPVIQTLKQMEEFLEHHEISNAIQERKREDSPIMKYVQILALLKSQGNDLRTVIHTKKDYKP